jgi:tetratricopeptide (TPR) repeat protein
MIRILIIFFLLVSYLDAHCLNTDSLNKADIVVQEVKDALYYQQQAKRADNAHEALELSKKALSLRSANLDENWVADVRVNMASALLRIGIIKEAFSEFLTAEKIYTETGNISSKANTLALMAKFYEQNAAWKDASYYYKSAQKLYQSIGKLNQAALIALHLTDISLIQNNLAEANGHVSYSIRQFDLLNSKTGLGLSYVKQAEIFRRQKQYKKAERLILKSALPFLRSTGYRAGRIGCFDVLAKIYRSQSRYSEAKWFFIQANTQARKLNDVEGIIISLINLGKVKVQIGDYDLARRDFKEAQLLASQQGNLFLQAEVKDAYAFLYKEIGSQIRFEAASESAEELKDSLTSYLNARAESARTAEIKIVPVSKKKTHTTVPGKKEDFLIAKIIAASFTILIIILLVLRKLKLL